MRATTTPPPPLTATTAGSALRWSEGEPTSPGWWWLRAPNLSERVVHCQTSRHGLVHDYSFDTLRLHGRPYECAGPIEIPNAEPSGGKENHE